MRETDDATLRPQDFVRRAVIRAGPGTMSRISRQSRPLSLWLATRSAFRHYALNARTRNAYLECEYWRHSVKRNPARVLARCPWWYSTFEVVAISPYFTGRTSSIFQPAEDNPCRLTDNTETLSNVLLTPANERTRSSG